MNIEKPETKPTCKACGMLVGDAATYHPFLACAAFKQLRNGNSVEVNLRAVVEYGMKAQKAGITIEQAMEDVKNVR